jgi:hypothetical protein
MLGLMWTGWGSHPGALIRLNKQPLNVRALEEIQLVEQFLKPGFHPVGVKGNNQIISAQAVATKQLETSSWFVGLSTSAS